MLKASRVALMLALLCALPATLPAQQASPYSLMLVELERAIAGEPPGLEGMLSYAERVVTLYADAYGTFGGSTIPAARRDIARQGIELFLRAVFALPAGTPTAAQVLRVVRLVFENRTLVTDLMLSEDAADAIAERIALIVGRQQAATPAPKPVDITAAFCTLAASKNEIRIGGVWLVADEGLEGGSNRAVDAGETLFLSIALKNTGKRAWRSTSAFLFSEDPYVQVDESEVVYSQTRADDGETATFGPGMSIRPPESFMLSISPDCPDGHRATLRLRVWDSDLGGGKDEYAERFTLLVYRVGPVRIGDLLVDDDLPGKSDGNGNHVIEAGETIEYKANIRNEGPAPLSTVEATMKADAAFIGFLPGDETLLYRTIAGKTEKPIAASFIFSVNTQPAPAARPFTLQLAVKALCRGYAYTWVRAYPEAVRIPDSLVDAALADAAAREKGGDRAGAIAKLRELGAALDARDPRRARLRDALAGISGSLVVETDPSPADITIDGVAVGPSPLTVEALAAGVHVVEATARGRAPFTVRVEVAAGRTARIRAALEPMPPLMPLVSVPPGTFNVATPKGVREVRLTRGFLIGTFEVTRDQYDRFCAETGTPVPDPRREPRGARPVMNVTWYGAVQFCNWLSDREDLPRCYTIAGKDVKCDFTATGYRLPTEAEWEWAARGGPRSRGYVYSGSNVMDEVAWTSTEEIEPNVWGLHEIGKRKPNELGIFDMSGNAAEWCWDIFVYDRPAGADPVGSGKDPNRVVRGGSAWQMASSEKLDVKTASREGAMPGIASFKVGFRVVRTVR